MGEKHLKSTGKRYLMRQGKDQKLKLKTNTSLGSRGLLKRRKDREKEDDLFH